MLGRFTRCSITPRLSSPLCPPGNLSRRTLSIIARTSRRSFAEPPVRTGSRTARLMATVQPEWRAPRAPSGPVQARLPKLSVYNSLTRSKTPFVPLDPAGKKVTWYACGPTVYDDADYFGFDVSFVMNITDVDDKIILAARQQYLLAQFLAEHKELDDMVRQTTLEAFEAYLRKNLPLINPDVRPEAFAQAAGQHYGHVLAGKSIANDGSSPGDKEAKVKMHINTARAASEAFAQSDATLNAFAAKASGVLLPYIDSQRSHTVQGKDHEIFTALTKRYERRFFDDMKALNVRYPDKLVRVTEHGPQIVNFVKRIQDNGFAYEHEGSIYYDTTAWEKSGGVYARLEPWNRNDKELQADGEGSLAAKSTSFKRSGADFALWKASKPGEPSWESPWGAGRPGWHIECSAMASDVLGQQMDIHSGGIDLAFPHHDNELAQSEAYWCESGKEGLQWVNYFLHMGHLSIQGSKMSKSLKNFETIRDALAKQEWTPRSLRVVFLLGAWKDGLEITGEVVKAGVAWEERVNNFFIKVRDLQMHPSQSPAVAATGTDASEGHLGQALEDAKGKFRDALCDSFDTPGALRVVADLITTYNSASQVSDSISVKIGKWITDMVVMLGLDADFRKGQMGWSGIDIPEKAKPFIYPLSELRDQVRDQAIKGSVSLESLGRLDEKDTFYGANQPYAKAYADFQRKIFELHNANASAKEYLAACDHLRDAVLWNLDIYLEDREKRHALVRPLSASLRQERQDREALVAAKAAAKEKAKAEADAAEKERLEKGKQSHLEMFRTSEYTAWDADGLPTKDADGKEVAKSKSKKLKKDWERQKKLHEAWQASQK